MNLKRSKGEKALFVVVFILFCIYAITILLPTIWLLCCSLKNPFDYSIDIAKGEPFKLPNELFFKNYKDAFSIVQYNGVSFFAMFLNSAWITVFSTALGLFVSMGYAYTLAKFKFQLAKLLYGIIIFQMTIPLFGTGGASMKFAVDSGLYNTPFYIILLSIGGGGMNFMIFYGAFKNHPRDYAEAVYMDGGGDFTVFFRIAVPFAMPIFWSLFILNGMNCWNDYMTPMMYLPSWPTLASGMYLSRKALINTGKSTVYFAATFISIMPMLILFIAFNDLIMKNVSIGGLKG